MKVNVSLFDYLEQTYHGEILIDSKTSKIVFANTSFCKMIGRSLEFLRGTKDVTKLFHPEHRAEIQESIRLTTQLDGEREIRFIDRNGDVVWTNCNFLVATFDFQDKGSSRTFVQITVVDITEQRRVIDKLPDIFFKAKVFRDDISPAEKQKVKKWLKKGLHNRNLLLRYIDPKLVYLNDAAITTLQYGGAESREIKLEHVQSLSKASIRSILFDVILNGTKTIKTGVVNTMGQSIPCEITYILESSEFPMYISGIAKDITEYQKLEVVRDSRFKAVVDQLDCLVCRYTPDFTLTFVNKGFCKYVGMESKDLVGTSYLDRFPKNLSMSLKTKLSHMNVDKRVILSEYVLKDSSGMQKIYSWADHGIYIKDKLVEVQAVGRDITKMKEVENHLDRRSREREKNSKLSSIAKSLYLIVGNRLRRVFDVVDHQGDKQDAIREIVGATDAIKELVDFYEPKEPVPKEVPINTVITKAVGAIYKNINIPTNVSISSVIETSKVVSVDPSQIITAIESIARNSIEAMTDDREDIFKLEITCRTVKLRYGQRSDMPSGLYIEIAICDNGPGINAELKDSMFQPFVTNDPYKKVGLGLASASNIVGYHNGGIFLYSEPSKGTKIEIYLPAGEEEMLPHSQLELFAS